MRRDKRIANGFRNDKIKNAVDTAIAEILRNPDWYSEDELDETFTYMLDCYAPDRLGTHQAKTIRDDFSIKAKNDEWLWEDLERIFSDVADILNKRIKLQHDRFEYLSLHFSHSEHCGDWGLTLVFELARD